VAQSLPSADHSLTSFRVGVITYDPETEWGEEMVSRRHCKGSAVLLLMAHHSFTCCWTYLGGQVVLVVGLVLEGLGVLVKRILGTVEGVVSSQQPNQHIRLDRFCNSASFPGT